MMDLPREKNTIHLSGIKKPKSRCSDGICSSKFRAGLFGVTGALLVAIAAIVLVYFPVLLQKAIETKLQVTEGSFAYEIFKAPPVPLFVYCHIFNITNYEDFQKKNVKPILQEVGPYVYREKWEKFNITFHDNGTISYRQKKTFFFDRELSSGDESDKVFLLNLPLLSAATMFKNTGPVLKMVLQTVFTMTEASLIINATVGEILFSGYDDPILKLFKEVMPNAAYPYDRFAFFYGKNGTDDGVYTIDGGKNNMQDVGKVLFWNGKSDVDTWYNSPCSNINGSNGELYTPNIDISEPITVFVPDMCRSITFNYDKPVEHEGIKGVRFIASPHTVKNASEHPDNWCFCDGDCLPSGVYNISRCKFDAPAVASFPHFYLGDPRYTTQVEGLHPDKNLHESYLDLEPHTGVPLEASLKVQVSLILQKIEGLTPVENVVNAVFPIVWLTQYGTINDEIRDLLKLATQDAYVYGKIIYFSLFIIGGLLLVSAILYYIFLTRRSKTRPFTIPQ